MGNAMDEFGTYLSFRLMKLLSESFSSWKAFTLGLIDANGQILKKPVSNDEKLALGIFEKTILELKRVLSSQVGMDRAKRALLVLENIKMANANCYNMLLSRIVREYPDVRVYVEINKINGGSNAK